MESRAIKIFAPLNKKIALKVIPGHFATSNSHINLYIDLTTMKTGQVEAAEAARVLAKQYITNTMIDTIVCLEGCEVIGAYMAKELSGAGMMSMNAQQSIHIISPTFNTNSQMILMNNYQPLVYAKHILVLAGSTTTGDTLRKSLDCIKYYGGQVQGISSIFSAIDQVDGVKINSIFRPKDLPDYMSYAIGECPMCQSKQRLEAIVNGYGYTKL